MGIVGFNSGMSDALQSIMEHRLKQKQQEFDNALKLKEESRLAEEHAANMELHREQLAQTRELKANAAAEKLQKNLGPGAETTPVEDKMLSSAGLPVSGGLTLPSTTMSAGGVLPMADVPSPDLSAPDAPGAPVAATPSTTGLGTLKTTFNPSVDQRTQPPQAYNPVTGSGARVPTLNTGSAADRQALAQRNALKAIGDNGDSMSDQEMFSSLTAAGYDPDKAAATVKALRPPKEPLSLTPEPAYEARGANGENLNGVVTIDRATGTARLNGQPLPPGAHVQKTIDPSATALRNIQLLLANVKLEGAQKLAAAPADILQGIKNGDIAADSTGKARAGTWAEVEALAAKEHYPLAQKMQEWKAAVRLVQSLNSQQQVQLGQSIVTTDHSLGLVDSLAQQWDSAGLGPLSRARLALAKQGTLGPDAASLAIRLEGQITDTTFKLASVYQGGGTPTDQSRALAKANLDSWWSKGTVHDMIDQSRWNLQNQNLAMQSTKPNVGGQSQAVPPPPAALGGPGTLPTGAPASGAVPSNVTITRDK